ncbi:MAG: TonB-dependent receptor, plug [Caulobacteraceae bacterium]|nr:TonB-dependent receptor, plug [Caulobacteraceae bacterium]
MSNANLRAVLLVSTTLATAGLTTAAYAQAPAPNANALEEVVVTATRQTSTVNKVALSVSAVTQKSLDQQGIRSVADLSSQVPGFTFRTSGGDNNPNLTLRGIGGNALAGTSGAAPTTGVYIDDQPLQKRNSNGLLTGSGSPTPLLYDLDRIEVLRGPQGTLYGGSSEGGTLRFIMPTPSLTTYSGSARVGVSTMAGGGMGNEEGIALGGPIVQDKLGFRIAGFRQDRPGWVDNFSLYDGHQFGTDVNWGRDYSLRGALLWQVTPDFKATVSVFHQANYDNDGSGVTTSSPAMTFAQQTYKESGTVNGVQFSFPSAVLGPPGGFTTPATTWLGNGNGTTTGRYLTATNVLYVNSPRRTIFTTPSLTLDYNWGDKLEFKSITAYTDDTTGGWQFTGGGTGVRSLPLSAPQAITKQPPLYANQPCPSGPGLVTPILTATCTLSPRFLPLSNVPGGVGGTFTPGPADVFGYYLYNNRRGQTTQEFRVSTIDPSWKLQFVVGAFIEHEHNHINVGSSWNETQITKQALGVDEAWFQGELAAPVQQKPGQPFIDVSTRNIDITEDEQALFGELNYNVTSKLKLTAGVRVTNYVQQFFQQYGGTVASAPSGFYGMTSAGESPTLNPDGSLKAPTVGIETNPNSTAAFATNYGACPKNLADAATVASQLAYAKAGCPYQYTATKLTEKPVTPKLGVSYQLTPTDLVYATYAEGYRPGGINPFVPPIMCAADLATLGLTQSPAQYQRDYVKSTEVGGKFRLFNGSAQVNAAAFHIEWDNVQFVLSLPLCAFSYVANAAKAASDGGELQFTGRTHGFTINGNVGYDSARYTATALGPPRSDGKPRTILVNKGDNLGVPDWTVNLGVQYDWHVFDFPAYARVDYAYTGKYMRTTSAGSAAFNATLTPNFINGDETQTTNARVGVYYKSLEIAGYVKNMFNAQQWINKTETTGTFNYSGNKQMPRVIGMQMNYRF